MIHPDFPTVEVVQHPLVQHKLTLMRDVNTGSALFRQLTREISLLLAYEVCRDLDIATIDIETPLDPMSAPVLGGQRPCIVSILRAGNGMLDGMLDLLPPAPVGHIGMYRDPATKVPVEYFLKLPDHIDERVCIVVDPMMATGGSAAAAVGRLKQAGATRLKFACVLAAPEGLTHFTTLHPDVPITTASVDERLDENAYIRPGLGDAGDRIFGTR